MLQRLSGWVKRVILSERGVKKSCSKGLQDLKRVGNVEIKTGITLSEEVNRETIAY